jgi:hypothetical protein
MANIAACAEAEAAWIKADGAMRASPVALAAEHARQRFEIARAAMNNSARLAGMYPARGIDKDGTPIIVWHRDGTPV